MATEKDIDQLLLAWSRGDHQAFEKLVPLVYEQLHAIAERLLDREWLLDRERPDHILDATGLVNEVYLKLVDQSHLFRQGRAHFFAVAAREMRRILIDYARRIQRRGGSGERPPLNGA